MRGLRSRSPSPPAEGGVKEDRVVKGTEVVDLTSLSSSPPRLFARRPTTTTTTTSSFVVTDEREDEEAEEEVAAVVRRPICSARKEFTYQRDEPFEEDMLSLARRR